MKKTTLAHTLKFFLSIYAVMFIFAAAVLVGCQQQNQQTPSINTAAKQLELSGVVYNINLYKACIDSLVTFSSRNLDNEVTKNKVNGLIQQLIKEQDWNYSKHYLLKQELTNAGVAVVDTVRVELKN